MLGVSAAERSLLCDPPLLLHRQKEVLDSLKKGDVSGIRVSHSFAADKIVTFGLDEGFLQEGLRSFPDPRKRSRITTIAKTAPRGAPDQATTVPIEVHAPHRQS